MTTTPTSTLVTYRYFDLVHRLGTNVTEWFGRDTDKADDALEKAVFGISPVELRAEVERRLAAFPGIKASYVSYALKAKIAAVRYYPSQVSEAAVREHVYQTFVWVAETFDLPLPDKQEPFPEGETLLREARDDLRTASARIDKELSRRSVVSDEDKAFQEIISDFDEPSPEAQADEAAPATREKQPLTKKQTVIGCAVMLLFVIGVVFGVVELVTWLIHLIF